MTSVNNYRIYCITEALWVYTWGQTEPTLCDNNHSHQVNINSIQIVDTITSTDVVLKNNTIDSFQEQITTIKNVQFDLKSFMGLSVLRNIIVIMEVQQQQVP